MWTSGFSNLSLPITKTKSLVYSRKSTVIWLLSEECHQESAKISPSRSQVLPTNQCESLVQQQQGHDLSLASHMLNLPLWLNEHKTELQVPLPKLNAGQCVGMRPSLCPLMAILYWHYQITKKRTSYPKVVTGKQEL